MKKKLLKLLQTKEEARQALVTKSEQSEDVAELRGINTQIAALNSEIAELRSMIDSLPDDEPAAEPTGERRGKSPVSHGQILATYGMGGSDQQETTSENRATVEKKEKEKRGKDLMEGRSVTVASSDIVLPKRDSATINQTFNKVSSLLDTVDVMIIQGGESFRQPYEIDNPEGIYTGEGIAASDTDSVFGYADISKSKITAYSEITNEIKKLPTADYESVVMNGISKSARRKLTKEILVGDGATGHLTGIFSASATAIDTSTDLEITAIDNTTLKKIVFSYGSDEEVEEQAVLILHKLDLMAFSQLKNTDGSDYHKIVTNGNTGTIDGIPYIINSAGCKALSAAATSAGAYCMAYGSLANYKLVIFSPLDVQRSTDYKFKEGMIAHRGEVYAGGNVVAHNGFVRVKKS